MLKAVWKYQFTLFTQGKQSFTMPVAAQFLYGAVQHNCPTMWFLVEPDCITQERHFMLVGTGYKDVPHDARYVFSFFMQEGACVFHIFETFEK